MAYYSNSEYYDMMYCVGAAAGSLRGARRLYGEMFVDGRPEPERRRLPSLECFRKMVHRLHQTGTFRGSSQAGRPSAISTDLEENILEHFETNPRTSTRRAAAILGIDHMQVWRVLRACGLHPYHIRPVQELTPNDYAPRLNFCQWYRDQVVASPTFASTVLWTDEASFTRGGIKNTRNEHIWAYENPHASSEASFQHQWRINVWAGIVGDVLFGPIFLPRTLNGENYLLFLRDVLEAELEDLPVTVYSRMTFQHDGAPAHFTSGVRTYLNTRFATWIGRGGPVAWPARSPDLTPLDFFLWGFIKNIVYAAACDSREEMETRIINAFRSV